MKSSTAAMKQIEPNDKEKILRHHTPESIILSLLRDNFKAKIHSIRELRNGREVWRITLEK
jgi:uncharacterized protein (DUF2249 family)